MSKPEDVIQIFSRKIKGKYVKRWVWSTRKYKTFYVEKVLGKVFEHFSEKRDVLQTIKRDLDASITLENAFINLMQAHFPDMRIETGGFLKCRNLVIGDVENADVIFGAHQL